jgi:hypothetical protein
MVFIEWWVIIIIIFYILVIKIEDLLSGSNFNSLTGIKYNDLFVSYDLDQIIIALWIT